MAKFHEFDKDSMARISRAVQRVENEVAVLRRQAEYRKPQVHTTQETTLLGKTSGSITAISTGSVLGKGTVDVYTIAASTAPTLASAGYSVTAYNTSGDAVGASKWVQLKRHYQSGLWFVDVEDCST